MKYGCQFVFIMFINVKRGLLPLFTLDFFGFYCIDAFVINFNGHTTILVSILSSSAVDPG
jgi:hypothetical protein